MDPVSGTNPSMAAFAAHATNGVGVAVLDKALEATKGTAATLLSQLPPPQSLDPNVGRTLDVRA